MAIAIDMGRGGEMLIQRVVAADMRLRETGELVGPSWRHVFQNAETRFVRHELGEFDLRRRRIELETHLAFFDEARIEAEERPVAGVDRELLLLKPEMQ